MVKLGIVGFGIMGERLLRAALDGTGGPVSIAAIHDPSPAALARLSAITPAIPMLPDAAAVIAACDCLYVATPPSSHLSLAGQALAAGRAVWLEKPLSHDTEAARRFVAGAEASGARAGVNFPMASSPAVARLRGWMEEGAVGRPASLSIEVDFATWPRGWQQEAASWLARREQGGFVREVVSHFLFLTHRLLGAPLLESATVEWAGEGLAESRVEARLVAGGIPVTLRGGVGTTPREDTNAWTLRGDRGAIRLRDWSIAEREGASGWEADPAALPNDRMRPVVLRGQLEKVAAMTRGEVNGLATLREALTVQEAAEAILSAG